MTGYIVSFTVEDDDLISFSITGGSQDVVGGAGDPHIFVAPQGSLFVPITNPCADFSATLRFRATDQVGHTADRELSVSIPYFEVDGLHNPAGGPPSLPVFACGTANTSALDEPEDCLSFHEAGSWEAKFLGGQDLRFGGFLNGHALGTAGQVPGTLANTGDSTFCVLRAANQDAGPWSVTIYRFP